MYTLIYLASAMVPYLTIAIIISTITRKSWSSELASKPDIDIKGHICTNKENALNNE